jgi:hypothetical protein
MQVWSHANWNFHYPQTADRRRLTALARDRNAAQKHVGRAEIVLLSADGVGTNEIMRRTGRQLGEERHSERQPEALLSGNTVGWGAVSFERSQIFGGTRHALKRLSILASFCRQYNYKSCVQLLQSVGRRRVSSKARMADFRRDSARRS